MQPLCHSAKDLDQAIAAAALNVGKSKAGVVNVTFSSHTFFSKLDASRQNVDDHTFSSQTRTLVDKFQMTPFTR